MHPYFLPLKPEVIQYKLWHILLDRGMNKSSLQKAIGIIWTAITKLTKDENVNTAVLVKICTVLKCDLPDIVKLVSETPHTDAKCRKICK